MARTKEQVGKKSLATISHAKALKAKRDSKLGNTASTPLSHGQVGSIFHKTIGVSTIKKAKKKKKSKKISESQEMDRVMTDDSDSDAATPAIASKTSSTSKKSKRNSTVTPEPQLTEPNTSTAVIIRTLPKPTRKYRFKPGTVVKREIKKQQKSTNLLIPKSTFRRVIREVCQDICGNGHEMRWKKSAFVAIQEAAESYLINLFADTSRLVWLFAKRVTVKARDLRIARLMAGDDLKDYVSSSRRIHQKPLDELMDETTSK